MDEDFFIGCATSWKKIDLYRHYRTGLFWQKWCVLRATDDNNKRSKFKLYHICLIYKAMLSLLFILMLTEAPFSKTLP